MKRLFASLAAAFTIGLGATQASADHRRYGSGAGWSLGIVIVDARYGYPSYRLFHRPYRAVRGCSLERASVKARHLGIRNQRIWRNERSIQVRGTRQGHPVRVVFARQPGCPIIR